MRAPESELQILCEGVLPGVVRHWNDSSLGATNATVSPHQDRVAESSYPGRLSLHGDGHLPIAVNVLPMVVVHSASALAAGATRTQTEVFDVLTEGAVWRRTSIISCASIICFSSNVSTLMELNRFLTESMNAVRRPTM